MAATADPVPRKQGSGDAHHNLQHLDEKSPGWRPARQQICSFAFDLLGLGLKEAPGCEGLPAAMTQQPDIVPAPQLSAGTPAHQAQSEGLTNSDDGSGSSSEHQAPSSQDGKRRRRQEVNRLRKRHNQEVEGLKQQVSRLQQQQQLPLPYISQLDRDKKCNL
ncbi:hypothetical protein WJX72_001142 [[Myrmecia] bisecta]|uniref:BZIP domain-containing protein n=1 Tax=[Myrmecia] bisecta TaxID=41462 RepID=A0AAW1QQ81_9CHLO